MKKIICIFLAIVILAAGQQAVAAAPVFDCTVVEGIPPTECDALVAFYNDAGGAQWTNRTNWLVSITPSNWFGVTVSSGHVTGIQLTGNFLVGSITPLLSNLSLLTSLELQDNYLWSGIPTEIGNLTNLEILRLDNSELHGNIPASVGNLTKLNILRLGNNILTGDIPASLSNLVNLLDPGMAPDGGDGLDLDRNHLIIPAGYPDPLNPFHDFLLAKDPDWHLLQWGVFTNCAAVFEIPETECDALVELYNQTGGPNWANNLYWLQINAISGWYGVEVESGHVTELFMPTNNMSGTLPASLADLPELVGLTLFDNHLTGNIPSGLGNATDMVDIYLFGNELTGPIPPGLGNMTKLKDLFLGGNHLTGEIPPELGALSSLVRLTMGGNHLTGRIPPQLGSLTSLEMLTLNGNQLRGNIPTELGGLTKLKVLDLYGNYLSGDVPGSFFNLVNLYDPSGDAGRDGLYLDYNYLNVPPDYPNPANSFHVFLNGKDPDWYLNQFSFEKLFLPVVNKP